MNIYIYIYSYIFMNASNINSSRCSPNKFMLFCFPDINGGNPVLRELVELRGYRVTDIRFGPYPGYPFAAILTSGSWSQVQYIILNGKQITCKVFEPNISNATILRELILSNTVSILLNILKDTITDYAQITEFRQLVSRNKQWIWWRKLIAIYIHVSYA